jgi:hypothetical protein
MERKVREFKFHIYATTIKQGMVDGLPDIHFPKRICEGCVLGKHPQEKFNKGKTQKASFPLDLIHSDLMGPFLHP